MKQLNFAEYLALRLEAVDQVLHQMIHSDHPILEHRSGLLGATGFGKSSDRRKSAVSWLDLLQQM